MSAGNDHGRGVSKLLRMMHKKDKSSSSSIDQSVGPSNNKHSFKVEPFTSGQSSVSASGSGSGSGRAPFNPTASAPAVFLSDRERARSRTPPATTTSFGVVSLQDTRRAGTPPNSSYARSKTPPAHQMHFPYVHAQQSPLDRLAGQYASSSRPRTPPTQASSSCVPQTAPHHQATFSVSRPTSPPLPSFPSSSAPHHTTTFSPSSLGPSPSPAPSISSRLPLPGSIAQPVPSPLGQTRAQTQTTTPRTAHSRPTAFHQPTAPPGSMLPQPFGPDAHAYNPHPSPRITNLHVPQGLGHPPGLGHQMSRSVSEGHDPTYQLRPGLSGSEIGAFSANAPFDANSRPNAALTGVDVHVEQRGRTPARHQHQQPHQQSISHLYANAGLDASHQQAQHHRLQSVQHQHPRRHPLATSDSSPKSSASGTSSETPPTGASFFADMRDPWAAQDRLHVRSDSESGRRGNSSSRTRYPSDGKITPSSASSTPTPASASAGTPASASSSEQLRSRASPAYAPPATPPPSGGLPQTPPAQKQSFGQPPHQVHVWEASVNVQAQALDRAPTSKRGPVPAHITTVSATPAGSSTRVQAPTPSQVANALSHNYTSSSEDVPAGKGKAPLVPPASSSSSTAVRKIKSKPSMTMFIAMAGPMGGGVALVSEEPPKKRKPDGLPAAPGPKHQATPSQSINVLGPAMAAPPVGFGVAARRRVPAPAALQSTSRDIDTALHTPPVTAATTNTRSPPMAGTAFARTPPSFAISHPTPPPTGSFSSLLPPQTPRTALIADALAIGVTQGSLVVGGKERPLPPVPRSPSSAGGVSPALADVAFSPASVHSGLGGAGQEEKVTNISQATYKQIDKPHTTPTISSVLPPSRPEAGAPIPHTGPTPTPLSRPLPTPRSPARRMSFHPPSSSTMPRPAFYDDTSVMSPSPLTGGGVGGTMLMTPHSARFSVAASGPYSAVSMFAGGEESPLGPPPSVASDANLSPGGNPEPVRPATRSAWAPQTPRTPFGVYSREVESPGPPKSSVSSPSPAAAYPPLAGPGLSAELTKSKDASVDAPVTISQRPNPRRRASSLDSGERELHQDKRTSRWGAMTPAKTRFVDPPAALRPPSTAVPIPVYSVRSNPGRPRPQPELFPSYSPSDDVVLIGTASVSTSPGPTSAASAGSNTSGKLSIDTNLGVQPMRARMNRLPTFDGADTPGPSAINPTPSTVGAGTMLPSALDAQVLAAHPVSLGVAPAAAMRLSSLHVLTPPPRARTLKTANMVRKESLESESQSDVAGNDVEELDAESLQSQNVHPHHIEETTGRRAHPKTRTVTTLWTELWRDLHSTHAGVDAGVPSPVPIATIDSPAHGHRRENSGGGSVHQVPPMPSLPKQKTIAQLLPSSAVPLPPSGQQLPTSPALPTLDFGSPLSVSFEGSPRSLLSMGSLGGIFLSPAHSSSALSPGGYATTPLSGISSGVESSLSPSSGMLSSSVSVSPGVLNRDEHSESPR